MIHITQHKKGLKMNGFISINTSCLINPFCIKARKNERSICKYCYAHLMEISHPRLKKVLTDNFFKLSTPLNDKEISEIKTQLINENRHYIRFNSLGEITGINNFMNYYNIAEKLPGFNFGLWTKRSNLINNFTDKKPDNLTLIFSNMVIDNPIETIPRNFTGVFNVVSYEYAINNDIEITCRGNCIYCLKCYTGEKCNVTELLKKGQNNIKKGFLKPLKEG